MKKYLIKILFGNKEAELEVMSFDPTAAVTYVQNIFWPTELKVLEIKSV